VKTTHTISHCILQTAAQFPAQTALSEWNGNSWRDITYHALIEQAKLFSESLRKQNIVSGERIVLISHNTIEAVAVMLGIWMADGTVILIDPDLPDAELQAQCQLADARFWTEEKNQYRLQQQHNHSTTVTQDTDKTIAAILFTSGTAGDFKAVMLTHHNFLYLTQFYSQLATPDGCLLTVLPLFHAAGLYCGILQPLMIGVRVVFFKKIDETALKVAFLNYHPNVLISVPRLLEVLYQKIQSTVSEKGKSAALLFQMMIVIANLSHRFLKINLGKYFFKKIHQQFGGRLQKILCGSAPLRADIQKNFLCFGFELLCSYGLTETCGPITLTAYSHRWKSGNVGSCVDRRNLKIADNGEILYAGDALMRGYFRDKVATEHAIHDSYFHTQDLGKLDHFGNLYITGRIKEWIVFSNGKKAMPEAIEKQYSTIPGMKEFSVFGVDQNQSMIAVLAFIPEKESDTPIIRQAILQRAAQLSSPYRVADILLLSEMPRSNTLKVKRHKLRELYLSAKKIKITHDQPADMNMQTVVRCFQSVLPNKKEWITPDITFVELGIDSLLAVQLCEKINETLSLQLKPTEFWFATTIRNLCQSLRAPKTYSENSHSSEKIAVVAMDGIFPGGAHNIDALWKNLLAGKDAIEKIPCSRFDIEKYYDRDFLAPGKINTDQGGFIVLPEFSGEAFQIKPRVADAMDPRQKILLVQIQRLLANYLQARDSEKIAKHKIGLFVGSCFDDFSIEEARHSSLEKITPNTGIGMANFSLAGFVAHHFNFQGPVTTVNTACSSSLTAVHQAMRALQSNDCDIVIAGGINLITSPEVFVSLSKGGFLSRDGRCKTFDASANGYVRSEGSGFVVLKRYDDALCDQDNIAGIMLSSAINHNGSHSAFTAPNGEAQMDGYREALARAHLSAHDIQYIESHGSGTQLGDAIEIQSIQRVYDQARKNPLYVGAIKSAIGHCEAAAGIAGFIKTILVLQHQKIPPNLHYHTPNPHIDFKNSAIQLPTQCVDLATPCRYAAVSSFGVSGTNVHMILKGGDHA